MSISVAASNPKGDNNPLTLVTDTHVQTGVTISLETQNYSFTQNEVSELNLNANAASPPPDWVKKACVLSCHLTYAFLPPDSPGLELCIIGCNTMLEAGLEEGKTEGDKEDKSKDKKK